MDKLLDVPLSEDQVNVLLGKNVPFGSDHERVESEGYSSDEVDLYPSYTGTLNCA